MSNDPVEQFESDFEEGAFASSDFDNDTRETELIPGTRVMVECEFGEVWGYTRSRVDDGMVRFNPEGVLAQPADFDPPIYVGMPVEIELADDVSATGRVTYKTRTAVEIQFDRAVDVPEDAISR